MQKKHNETIGTSKYLRLSQIKVSRILDQIRGKEYQEALLMLQFMPYRSCINIKKILESIACNAENNYGYKKNQLKVRQAFVTQGPKMKRFQPRAQGRAFPIHKPTCHITLSLIDK